jgi:hypothetical protein
VSPAAPHPHPHPHCPYSIICVRARAPLSSTAHVLDTLYLFHLTSQWPTQTISVTGRPRNCLLVRYSVQLRPEPSILTKLYQTAIGIYGNAYAVYGNAYAVHAVRPCCLGHHSINLVSACVVRTYVCTYSS